MPRAAQPYDQVPLCEMHMTRLCEADTSISESSSLSGIIAKGVLEPHDQSTDVVGQGEGLTVFVRRRRVKLAQCHSGICECQDLVFHPVLDSRVLVAVFDARQEFEADPDEHILRTVGHVLLHFGWA